MAAVASWSWGLAMIALVATTALRVSRLDERSLPGVRLAGFTTPIQLVCLLPWLTLAALAALHLVDNPFGGSEVWSLSAATIVAAYLTSPPSPHSRLARNDGPLIVLGSINVERDTPAAGEIASTLGRLDLDVLFVQEYTTATAAAFRSSGLLVAYPHVREDQEEGWFGAAILSRHPIVASERRCFGERPMTVAVLDIGEHRVTTVNVHIQAPVRRHDVGPWRQAFADLAELAASSDGTVVLAGDWNATLSHQPMRRLLRTGSVVDAHLASRRRSPRTWPVGRRHPPLLGLDHILVSPSIDVNATHELTVAGTDHRAVTAALRFPS